MNRPAAVASAAVASLFHSSRLHNSPITAIPPYLQQLAHGYEIQQDIIKLNDIKILSSNDNFNLFCGWKIGATNANAQKMMGFGPFYGPLFQSHLHITPMPSDPPTKISLSKLGTVFKAIESEIAIILKEDLPPLQGKTYSAEDIWSVVDVIIPAVEFAATRYSSNLQLTPAAIVADFAFNGCVYLSSKRYTPSDFQNSLNSIGQISTSLTVNSSILATSLTSSVMNNPIYSLTWLANELNSRNLMLKSGQLIMTGASIQSREIKGNDNVIFSFKNLPFDDEIVFKYEIQ